MRKIVFRILDGIAFFISLFMFKGVIKIFNYTFKRIYWYYIRRGFSSVGEDSFIEYPAELNGTKFIKIGNNFSSFSRLRLEAFEEHNGYKYSPEIVIGDNVSMNYDCHIGCVNKVHIGNNVLMGSRIFITDHFHGDNTLESIKLPPSLRKVVSRGNVIIEDNVWIGEGVAIMPNVTIGKNSIIGANSVVTKDVPANCIVAGAPAKIIRYIN